MDKVKTIDNVMENIKDRMVVMIGGFMGVGTPEFIIDAMIGKNVKDLTIIANDSSFPNKGLGRLIVNKQVKKIITSHIGLNPETGKQMNSGELGFKSGKGFFEWSKEDIDKSNKELREYLIKVIYNK